jgi:hypothetical protein
VRYLFSPLNEIVFNHFSRGEKQESVAALLSFIKAIIVFSVLVFSFGFNYSETFLVFLYGSKWVSDESIWAMRTYMLLVVFLGLNGVIEAFFFAVSQEKVNKYNFWSFFTTALYLASTVLLLKLGYGVAGLFMGNIINMSSRIILCWLLEIRHHISFSALLSSARPPLSFIICSLSIFLLCHKDYGYALKISQNTFLQLALGGILFMLNLVPILFDNR